MDIWGPVMKRVDIETLVRWAYRDELPKVGRETTLVAAIRSGWAACSRYGELLTVVQESDIVNRWGLVPLDVETDGPHPDAMAVADAVERLALHEVDIPADWYPLADMGDLGAEGVDAVRRGVDRLLVQDAQGRRMPRQSLARLVIRHAILGDAPAWEAEAPTRRMVSACGKPKWFRQISQVTPGAFGPCAQTVEVDGYNATRQRPFPGAYRKFELVPDPVATVRERGEYEMWHAALNLLLEDLHATGLTAHQVLPSPRPPRPWLVAHGGAVSSARILPSVMAPAPIPRDGRKKNRVAA